MKKLNKTRVIMIIVMLIITLFAVFPFYSMLIMGTYKTTDLYRGLKLVPGNYLKENLNRILQTPISRFYMNSLIVSVCTSVLSVGVCSMAGFVLAKYEFKFRKALTQFIMLTMMVPSTLGLIAYVIEMRKLHLTDTLLPLIVPFAANAFGVYWLMQFAKDAIPFEVMESARIDGCTEFQIYYKIAMPFLRPACLTLILLSFLWSWNDFMIPLVTISKAELYTIPLGIRQMSGMFFNDTAAQILGLTITSLPILILFGIFNKSLIAGLASSAVKG